MVRSKRKSTVSLDVTIYIALTMALTIVYASVDIYVPVVKNIASIFQVSISSASKFNSFYLVGITVPIVVLSFFMDRFDKLYLIKYSNYFFCFFSGLILVIKKSFWMVCLFRLLQGGAASIIITVAIPLILDRYQSQEAIQKLSTINSWITLALLAAPSIAIGLVKFLSLEAIHSTIFFLALCCARLLLNCPLNHNQSRPNTDPSGYFLLLTDKQFMNFTIAYAVSHALFLLYIFTSPFLVNSSNSSQSAMYQTIIMLAFVSGNALLSKLVGRHDLEKIFRGIFVVIISLLFLISFMVFYQHNLMIIKLLICGYAFNFAMFVNLLIIERAKAFSVLQKNAFIYTIGIFFRFLIGAVLTLVYSFSQSYVTPSQFLISVSALFAVILSINRALYLRFKIKR